MLRWPLRCVLTYFSTLCALLAAASPTGRCNCNLDVFSFEASLTPWRRIWRTSGKPSAAWDICFGRLDAPRAEADCPHRRSHACVKLSMPQFKNLNNCSKRKPSRLHSALLGEPGLGSLHRLKLTRVMSVGAEATGRFRTSVE
jgi:hypothetical protein